MSFRIILSCIASFRTTSFCIISFRIISFRIISFRIISSCIASFRTASFRTASFRIILSCIASSCIALCRTVSSCTASFRITLLRQTADTIPRPSRRCDSLLCVGRIPRRHTGRRKPLSSASDLSSAASAARTGGIAGLSAISAAFVLSAASASPARRKNILSILLSNRLAASSCSTGGISLLQCRSTDLGRGVLTGGNAPGFAPILPIYSSRSRPENSKT